MNLVTLEKSMPRRSKTKRPELYAPGLADAMRRTMCPATSVMPLLYGGGDPFEFWQPSSVSGFTLDINPHFQVTTGLDGSRVTCASIINNKASATDTFANSTLGLQPTYESTGWGGTWLRPSILGDGASRYMVCGSSLASTLVGGTDTLFWLYVVGKFVTLPVSGAACPFFIGRSSATNPLWDWFASSSGVYSVFKRDNLATGGGPAYVGGTPDTANHVHSFAHASNTTITFRRDGSSLLTGNIATGALTVDSIALFSTYSNGSPQNQANFRLARLLAGTGTLSAQDDTDITAVLTAAYL